MKKGGIKEKKRKQRKEKKWKKLKKIKRKRVKEKKTRIKRNNKKEINVRRNEIKINVYYIWGEVTEDVNTWCLLKHCVQHLSKRSLALTWKIPKHSVEVDLIDVKTVIIHGSFWIKEYWEKIKIQIRIQNKENRLKNKKPKWFDLNIWLPSQWHSISEPGATLLRQIFTSVIRHFIFQ